MSSLVLKSHLNNNAILQAGGSNFGNEEFCLFGCPNCKFVYLLELEVDTVYLDGSDLTKRFNPIDKIRFKCVNCDFKFVRNGAWVGAKAPDVMKVTFEQLRKSEWAWVTDKNA